jgi:hypothetical protein
MFHGISSQSNDQSVNGWPQVDLKAPGILNRPSLINSFFCQPRGNLFRGAVYHPCVLATHLVVIVCIFRSSRCSGRRRKSHVDRATASQVGPAECTTSAGACSLYGPNGVDGAYCCTSTFPLKALAHVGRNAVPLGWNLECANMFQEFEGVCAVPVCNSCCGGQAVSTECDDPLA